MAKTFNIDGYKVFCPPHFTTGPRGKEAGVITLVAKDIAIYAIERPDLNNKEDSATFYVKYIKRETRKNLKDHCIVYLKEGNKTIYFKRILRISIFSLSNNG